MGSYSDNDVDEYRFFDAREDVLSDSESGLGCSNCDDCSYESTSFEYDVWLRSPSSVKERRAKFLERMGVDNLFRDRIMENSGAVLRNSVSEDNFSSSRSVLSSLSTDQTVRELESDANVVFNSRISNGRRECEASELVESGVLSKHHEETVCVKRFQTAVDLRPCLSAKEFVQKEYVGEKNSPKMADRVRSFLFRRVNSISCISGQDSRGASNGDSDSNRDSTRKIQRVKVKHNKKHLKELSALFEGQDITAHDGAILCMKFSPDGQYLASAGEDRIIRVWRVVENDRSQEIEIPDADPSCLYFAVNHLSQLAPLDKEKIAKPNILGRTANSACVIFPPKIFHLLEEPLHTFHGHKAEILDLSWSKNNHLLSSSVDKTVCLWKVGCDECLGIFPHSNYVTSVHFNPLNDDSFISGSIDGKLRIWEIRGRRVVDWTDSRDTVTAVSYRPDGLGGIIGFMTGNCRLFSLEDNQLQLDAVICLTSKKKSLCKRITGFQFFPKDSSKVMVMSAGSHLRILSGINVVKNVKVPRKAGNQIHASFTSDGEHIISASEDSGVYMWNFPNIADSSLCQQKALKSYECFSGRASIAIPWYGMNVGDSCDKQKPYDELDDDDEKSPLDQLRFSSERFSLGRRFFIESIPRGSATWPEEKLPPPSSSPRNLVSSMRKFQNKFINTAFQSSLSSNAWCLVIVTAGLDGRIKSFLNYGLPIPL